MRRIRGEGLPTSALLRTSHFALRTYFELPSRGQFTSRAVGQLTGIDEDVDLAVAQVAADQLFRQRVFDVALDGAA